MRLRVILLTFAIVLTWTCVRVQAQDFPVLHYTTDDGLASNTVYETYQDPDGLIWIGTDKGISVFNGIKFQNYTTADGLSDNECFFFQPDKQGRLWIGTYNGKLCFYKDGKFHNERNTPWLKLPIKSSLTTNIIVNSDSSIFFVFHDSWVITELKDTILSNYTDDFMKKQFEAVGFLKGSLIFDIKKNIAKETCVIYTNTKYTLSKKSKILDSLPEKINIHKVYRNNNKPIYLSDRGIVYDEEFKKILKGDISSITSKSYLNSILIVDTNIVVAAQCGLFINLKLAMKIVANSILLDKNDGFWIGTKNEGLYYLKFKTKNKKWELPKNNDILYVGKIKQSLIWVDKNNFVSRLDLNNGLLSTIMKLKNQRHSLNNFSDLNWISNNRLFHFSDGVISTFNFENQNLPIVYTQKYHRTTFWIPKKVIYSNKSLFILCTANLVEMNFKNESTIRYKNTYLLGRKIYDIGITMNHKIWCTSVDGASEIYIDSLIPQPQFKNLSFRKIDFFSSYLLGITHTNQLVVCNQYERNQIIVDTVTNKGAVWDKIYKINDSTAMVSTNNYYRILKFHPSNNRPKYELMVLEDPIIPYQPQYFFTDNKEAFFFTKNSVQSFPVEFLLQKHPLPKIKYSFLQSPKQKMYIKDSVSISYSEAQNLKISFQPISFFHQELAYQYSINQGNEPDVWNNFSGEELNLLKIGYGNYTVKIRIKTLNDEYSKPSVFTLLVSKPYWAKWWFISLILIVLFGITIILARIGLKRRLKKKEQEIKFMSSEYKTLNALMNPHFIFNSLNSVQSMVNNKENEDASKYIRIFSDMIRQNMQNMTQDLIPLDKEMDLVENYLRIEKLRFKDKLNYCILVDEDVDLNSIKVPPLLIQPLVENAIKHGIWPQKGNDGMINIVITEKEETLTISIQDNGKGIEQTTNSDTLYESYAMKNMQQRIDQLNKIHNLKISFSIQNIQDKTGKTCGAESCLSIQLD